MTTPLEAPLDSYLKCMKQIVHRVSIIAKIIGAEDKELSFFDMEIVCLHFRKIIELMVFSTIASHQKSYLFEYPTAKDDWKIDIILENVRRINPDFYPKPITLPKKISEGYWSSETIKNDFFTEEDLKKLYQLCSNALHVKNFLCGNDIIYLEDTPHKLLAKITKLLDTHQITLKDNIYIGVWCIRMKEEGQPKADVLTAPIPIERINADNP